MCVLPSNWKIDDRALYISEYNTLVLGDLHFGRLFNKKEELEYKQTEYRIKVLLNKFQPSKLILNGDIFNKGTYHRRGIDILENMQFLVDEIILLEGNHEEKSNGFNMEISNKFTVGKEYMLEDILIHHGHRTPSKKAKHHIVSHLHPRKGKQSVYLHCDDGYYGSSVTVLPAFSKRVGCIEYTDYNVNIPIITDGKPIEDYEYIFA